MNSYYLYFIQMGTGAIRINIGKVPEHTVLKMQQHTPKHVRLIGAVRLDGRRAAQEFRDDLYEYLNHEHIRDDWYSRRITKFGAMKTFFHGTVKHPQWKLPPE